MTIYIRIYIGTLTKNYFIIIYNNYLCFCRSNYLFIRCLYNYYYLFIVTKLKKISNKLKKRLYIIIILIPEINKLSILTLLFICCDYIYTYIGNN